MKKSLLNFGFVTVFGLFAANVSAQVRSIPLNLTVTAPTSGATIATGAEFTVAVSIENDSETSLNLNVNDTIFFNVTGYHEEGEYSGALLPSAINAGETVTLQLLSLQNTNPGASAAFELCVSIIGPAQTNLGGSWENSNSEQDACVTVTLAGGFVGIEENTTTSTWSVYPNPVNNHINITTDRLSEDAQLIVHNSVGQRVYEQKLNALRNFGAINIADWENGIYMISITQNGTISTQRVLVQH